jgi:hypothetical protein
MAITQNPPRDIQEIPMKSRNGRGLHRAVGVCVVLTLAGGAPTLLQWPGRSMANTFQPWCAK